MRDILTSRMRSLLRRFASGKVLVAFDFDGTLAPIVSDPEKAKMRSATRNLLGQLASSFPCIVVSGRSREDVRGKLRGIPVRECIGNHGIEPWKASSAMAAQVEGWIPVLKERLGHLHGVVVENKRFSLSVHYRGARHKKKALNSITRIAQNLEGARLVGGKLVINIVPRGAPGKGRAVEQARRKTGCEKVIYAGDDATDEDVFAMGKDGRFLTIRVGANRCSLARFCIRNQREIDRLLKDLVDLRAD